MEMTLYLWFCECVKSTNYLHKNATSTVEAKPTVLILNVSGMTYPGAILRVYGLGI